MPWRSRRSRSRRAPRRPVDWLASREPVIELAVGRDVRAYPLEILIWHEIVNDRIGGVPVAVTFCPLCNTAIAFDRRVRGRTLSFGTTGSLRDSDLVMYDRRSESWWQEFGGRALVDRLRRHKAASARGRVSDGSVGRDTHGTRSSWRFPRRTVPSLQLHRLSAALMQGRYVCGSASTLGSRRRI